MLTHLIRNMDKIAELPPRENMSLDEMSRFIEIRGNPQRYLVRDVQSNNSNGKREADYTCWFEEGEIKTRDGLQY